MHVFKLKLEAPRLDTPRGSFPTVPADAEQELERLWSQH